MSKREPAWWSSLTRLQWIILVIAWFGWVFDVMDTALFNFAKQPMLTEMLGGERNYRLHGAAVEGNIQMVFLIGWSFGGLVFGLLADRWGRTRTLVLTILLYCCLTGLTALCRTPEQVALARFLTALGIGGEWAAGAALVAESLPDKARAAAASVLQSAAAIGPFLAALINLGLAHQSWRWLFLVGVAPALLCVLVRTRVQEPPRAKEKRSFTQPLREIARPPWRRRAIVATVFGIVGVAGAQLATFWIPNLIKQASVGLAESAVRERTSYLTLCVHVGTLLGVIVFPWLAERLGRVRALALFFALSPLSIWFAVYGGVQYERLLLLMPLACFFAVGLSAGFVLYFPELFPARMRATGMGLAYNVGRVLSAPTVKLTGSAIESAGGNVAAGLLVASGIYLMGLAACAFAPETKGKSLERLETGT